MYDRNQYLSYIILSEAHRLHTYHKQHSRPPEGVNKKRRRITDNLEIPKSRLRSFFFSEISLRYITLIIIINNRLSRDDFIGIPDRSIQTRPRRGESLDGVPTARRRRDRDSSSTSSESCPLRRVVDGRDAIADAGRRHGFPRPAAIRNAARDEYERDDRVQGQSPFRNVRGRAHRGGERPEGQGGGGGGGEGEIRMDDVRGVRRFGQSLSYGVEGYR